MTWHWSWYVHLYFAPKIVIFRKVLYNCMKATVCKWRNWDWKLNCSRKNKRFSEKICCFYIITKLLAIFSIHALELWFYHLPFNCTCNLSYFGTNKCIKVSLQWCRIIQRSRNIREFNGNIKNFFLEFKYDLVNFLMSCEICKLWTAQKFN